VIPRSTGGEGGINGGIMTLQKSPWPGNMASYIDVDALDAYAEKIRSAGGKIVVDKMEVPGARIAFHSKRDGNYEIYVMNTDGSGVVRITDHPADDYNPSWFPDDARSPSIRIATRWEETRSASCLQMAPISRS
jgi:hypothetical protein